MQEIVRPALCEIAEVIVVAQQRNSTINRCIRASITRNIYFVPYHVNFNFKNFRRAGVSPSPVNSGVCSGLQLPLLWHRCCGEAPLFRFVKSADLYLLPLSSTGNLSRKRGILDPRYTNMCMYTNAYEQAGRSITHLIPFRFRRGLL